MVLVVVALSVLFASGLGAMPRPAGAADIGTVDFSYSGASAPTGQKPQSKLWFAQSTWWGVMFNSTVGDFHIYRYSNSTDRWTDTGVLVDDRANSYVDVLFDGTRVYVVTAGQSASSTSVSPRVLRYSYSASANLWTLDTGFPVTINAGGAEAYVIAKDSVGTVWVTFTQGSKVYVTHSAGSDTSWVPKYQLPTPNNESKVNADDISTIVSYDGDKVGVLWSNQNTQKMYFSSHSDGTSDLAWNLDVVYDVPEGADDHMNIKSVVGDPSGRIFAVFKTSMNGSTDPLINLLVLRPNGTWFTTPFATVPYQHTRAIVQLDVENRVVYVFAAAPCCSGGVIYMKQTSMDHPSFSPGLGTPFIASSTNPKINNPTSTKQNLDSNTNLLVLAGDDTTRRYLHNIIDLQPAGPDLTPPETTITASPAPETTDTTATFSFASSEPNSTFLCALDGAASSVCVSPVTYTDLPLASHDFSVSAVDSVGNMDQSPATASWSVVSQTPPIFSDDFSSGSFAVGGWVLKTAGTGSLAVEEGAVAPANFGGRLVSPTGDSTAYAYIRKTLPSAQTSLDVAWTTRVTLQSGSTQQVGILRLYDTAGTRVLRLSRQSQTNAIILNVAGSDRATTGTLPLNTIKSLNVKVSPTTSGWVVRVDVNGSIVYNDVVASMGSGSLNRLEFGDNSTSRTIDYRIDDVVVRT